MNKSKDIKGQKFGMLTAIEQEPSNGTGPRWRCLCECGKESVVRGTALRHGQIKSCGCLRRDRSWSTGEVDIKGKTFGRLVAVEKTKDKSGRAAWLCVCDCGCSTIVRTGLLTSGNTKSCGCGQVRCKASSKQPDIRGIYAVCFATGMVKFGRSKNVRQRIANYKRDAVLAGGAICYAAACENIATAERRLLNHASKHHTPMLYELFDLVTKEQAVLMLRQFGGSEPINLGAL